MNISRFKWVPYIPDIGDNRTHEFPLTLEVRTGLTRSELKAWGEAVAKAKAPVVKRATELQAALAAGEIQPEQVEGELEAAAKASDAAMVAVIEENVRLVGEHTVDGAPLKTMADYAALVGGLAGPSATKELLGIVPRLNTLTEEDSVFYARLSGGLATTQPQSAAKK